MHFSSGINRPPYEAMDGFLQVTSGCSHASCKFCTFYKDAPFAVSPMEEIEEDIKEIRDRGWKFQRIFLQGADPFILPYNKLMQVAELIHQYLPSVESIGGYARVDNVRNKTVEQLRRLAEVGYSNFYFGNESGDDKLLERMNKGYKAEVVVEQLSKLDEAGMKYIVNFLGGLGGYNYGLSHARESAKVINQLHPTLVYASELTLFPDTPLSKDKQKGLFAEATEVERLEEMYEFIRCLDIDTVFKAEHVTIPVPIRGKLPEDKQNMLELLQEQIDIAKEGGLDGFRKRVMSL
ncbi:radical SAM protein [Desulfobulbus oligotrophicus]|uniref:Radical SAM protein n=1 Tax=Desulfobulbus oligotrophicus TaxID=1909699 RepID=A0A7T5VAZ3_9BACT|nr:radical SAM protein [Desulfobulbus oligotrophicus]QQG64419.1 radical SAM protein [Desulfobulbus oligotrophicus]